MGSSKKLPRSFYAREDTLAVARELLGKVLVVVGATQARVSGVIVETEAYLGAEDRASHAYNNRRTARTAVMYLRGGTAYVYFVYGMYYQFNVVTGPENIPHAVLIRAVEPVEGLDVMRAMRPVRRDIDLTSGPGKLCRAMGIDISLNGADLLGDRVWIEAARDKSMAQPLVMSGPRIGISYAREHAMLPWRFWIDGNPYVSRRDSKRNRAATTVSHS